MLDRLAAWRNRACARHAVAELLGDALRGDVVDEGSAQCDLGPEAGKREFEHGCALLRTEPPALVGGAEPGPGHYLTLGGEVLRLDALRADRLAVEERDQVERPLLGSPRRPRALVELHEGVEPQVVGPGHEERHLLGRVDAAFGDSEQRDELVLDR